MGKHILNHCFGTFGIVLLHMTGCTWFRQKTLIFQSSTPRASYVEEKAGTDNESCGCCNDFTPDIYVD